MVRKKSYTNDDVKRGAWTAHEDKILYDYIMSHGIDKWRSLPVKAGLNRCGKSCRLRWLNYLRPDIKRGNITEEEEDLIIRLHKLLGNRWSLIAGRIPGRTDNEIKNYWNTCLGKKLTTKSPAPPSDTNIKSNNSTVPSFNRSEEVQCNKAYDSTEQRRKHENNNIRNITNTHHRDASVHPNGSEPSNPGAVGSMPSPCVNTGSFSHDGSNDARTSNNGESHRGETMYPLLDENNVWDPFSF